MPRFSAHLGYLFSDRPLNERFAAARRFGFAAVEHPAPYELPAERTAALLQDTGLVFAQLAAPAGDPSKGEKGLAVLPDRRAEFRASIDRALDYADAVGCTMIHVMSGIAPADADEPAVWGAYIDNMRFAAEAFARRGKRLLIEPISRRTVSAYFMSDPERALEAADAIGPNAVLLFDVYHAKLGGFDPLAFIRSALPRIAHVHIADEPGRHEPGTGRLDFATLFRLLDERGFEGLVGCEYVPSGRTEDGLGWLAKAGATVVA